MKSRIGIVGGGQLARMLIFPAKQMGFHVTVLDPTQNSPAGQVADKHIVADLDDENAMQELAKHSDFITLEWELANPTLLEKIEKKGTSVNPSPKTLRMIKDKYQQKVFLQKAGIPVAPFANGDDIHIAGKKFGYPFLLKAKMGAYDGRGNYLIKNRREIQEGLAMLKGLERQEVYVEKFVPFEKELAIMVARNTREETKTFPLVQTVHKNNILYTVLAPAPVSKAIVKKAEALARKVMLHLQGAGVFGIEMFLTKKGDVLVNEIAPRVHNSGHYSIESCATSQFEQHIRTITGLPLGDTRMKTPFAVMLNILGTRQGKASLHGIENALKIPGISVHIYGKTETKLQRKMGHITVVGQALDVCLARAKKARRLISI